MNLPTNLYFFNSFSCLHFYAAFFSPSISSVLLLPQKPELRSPLTQDFLLTPFSPTKVKTKQTQRNRNYWRKCQFVNGILKPINANKSSSSSVSRSQGVELLTQRCEWKAKFDRKKQEKGNHLTERLEEH